MGEFTFESDDTSLRCHRRGTFRQILVKHLLKRVKETLPPPVKYLLLRLVLGLRTGLMTICTSVLVSCRVVGNDAKGLNVEGRPRRHTCLVGSRTSSGLCDRVLDSRPLRSGGQADSKVPRRRSLDLFTISCRVRVTGGNRRSSGTGQDSNDCTGFLTFTIVLSLGG